MFVIFQQALLEKLYGKSILTGKTLNAASQIIESAAVLKLQQQQQQLQQRDREVANGFSTTPSKSNSSILANGDLPFKVSQTRICTI